ncbi:MAG: PKD-like family lipoprotein [Odoribacter splanchnicus]
MKKYIGITCILAILFIAGCIDDRGNYDYLPSDEVWSVKISGLLSADTCLVGDELKLEPVITGDGDLENLKYSWFLYPTVASGAEDTLSHDKTLDWVVNCDLGTWNLMFEVRDTVRDLMSRRTMRLTVGTAFSTGWFVLETDGTGTDIDILLPDGTTREDLLTSLQQTRLEGTPRKICYKARHWMEVENADGTTSRKATAAFILLSENDMRVYGAEDMRLLKNREECFYEVPARLRPREIHCEYSDDQLNIDGQYYMLGSGNIGKFGYPLLGADGTSAYDIHEEGVYAAQNGWLWDKKSSSFVYAYYNNSQLLEFSDPVAGNVNFGPTSHTGHELLHLLSHGSARDASYNWTYNAFALWKDRTGKCSILDLAFQKKTTYPIVGEYTVPEGSHLPQTDVITIHSANDILFFAHNGNELWQHTIGNKTSLSEREWKVYAFPAGEQIAYMYHYTHQTDRLMVLTNSAGGWKLYALPFIGGGNELEDITPGEALIGQGNGQASYVIRMENNAEVN